MAEWTLEQTPKRPRLIRFDYFCFVFIDIVIRFKAKKTAAEKLSVYQFQLIVHNVPFHLIVHNFRDLIFKKKKKKRRTTKKNKQTNIAHKVFVIFACKPNLFEWWSFVFNLPKFILSNCGFRLLSTELDFCELSRFFSLCCA